MTQGLGVGGWRGRMSKGRRELLEIRAESLAGGFGANRTMCQEAIALDRMNEGRRIYLVQKERVFVPSSHHAEEQLQATADIDRFLQQHIANENAKRHRI